MRYVQGGLKSKPLPNFQKNVLNHIKSANEIRISLQINCPYSHVSAMLWWMMLTAMTEVLTEHWLHIHNHSLLHMQQATQISNVFSYSSQTYSGIHTVLLCRPRLFDTNMQYVSNIC